MDQRNTHEVPSGNTSKGFFFLFLGIAPSTVKRVPKIINSRNKQSFASIAFFSTKKKEKYRSKLFDEISLDFPWKLGCRRIKAGALSYSL